MVSMLNRKLGRDLWRMRSQVLAIVLLVASGVAVFGMSLSNYMTLLAMQQRHYEHERFGDLFVQARRAPLPLAARLAEVDGVAAVEARIVQPARVDRPDSDLAIGARIVSIPARQQPELNRLRLVSGRWVDPGRTDEVIVNIAYAEAWHVRPDDAIDVILNGRRQRFRVVGTAMSPEFVFVSRPGLPLPDDRAYAIIWAGRSAVEAAFDMSGAFNDLVVRLTPEAHAAAVAAEVDRLLEPYGGGGAITRRDHASHRFVEDELAEQRTMSIVVPLIFLGIASFLLHVVMGRLVEVQREQIAALKALGYANEQILLHYLKFAAVVVLLGVIAGAGLGAWLGSLMIETYRPFFRFPDWSFEFRPWIPLAAGVLAFAAAAAGIWTAVQRVVLLPAAVAMRSAEPVAARVGRITRLLTDLVPGPRWRMVVRSIAGRPLRSLMTMVGLAFAVPLVVMGLFWWDALGTMIEVNFERIERGDIQVTLSQPAGIRAVRELAAVPGVHHAEGQRIVAARLRYGHRSYRLALQGLPADGVLKRPLDSSLQPIPIPADGLVLSRRLAQHLDVRPGEEVIVEVLEGGRPLRRAPVVGLADDILGFNAYTEIASLNRLMREADLVNAIVLSADPAGADAVQRRLQAFPRIEAVTSRRATLAAFNDKITGLLTISAVVLTCFGILIAVGVVYNAARVAFQEHAWELASLRILGFTRREVSQVLFAELALMTLVAVPLGLVLSRWLIALIFALRENESFDLPAVVHPATLGYATIIVIVAVAASAIGVRGRVDRMDLVAVLKTRD